MSVQIWVGDKKLSDLKSADINFLIVTLKFANMICTVIENIPHGYKSKMQTRYSLKMFCHLRNIQNVEDRSLVTTILLP